MVVLSDGRLASGSGGFLGDKTIRVWNLGSGACDRVLEGHAEVRQGDGRIYCVYERMMILRDLFIVTFVLTCP